MNQITDILKDSVPLTNRTIIAETLDRLGIGWDDPIFPDALSYKMISGEHCLLAKMTAADGELTGLYIISYNDTGIVLWATYTGEVNSIRFGHAPLGVVIGSGIRNTMASMKSLEMFGIAMPEGELEKATLHENTKTAIISIGRDEFYEEAKEAYALANKLSKQGKDVEVIVSNWATPWEDYHLTLK